MLTLLTFNVGLLSLLGGRIQPAPHVLERLAALPDALLDSHADVIALQEIYAESHRRFLISRLRDAYPHAAYSRGGRLPGLESGLMVFSRHAVTAEFERFRTGTIDEMLFDRKGILATTITAGAFPSMALFNVHTTAGGLFSHPESARVDAIRNRQIEQLLNLTESRRDAMTLIAGDLNAGPGVSENNYRLLEKRGFMDVHRMLHRDCNDPTWEPTNLLNRNGPHKTSPPQRIDHVFVRSCDLDAKVIRPVSSSIVFKEARVPVSGNRKVTLSDHYGLLVVLDIAGAPGATQDSRKAPAKPAACQ